LAASSRRGQATEARRTSSAPTTEDVHDCPRCAVQAVALKSAGETAALERPRRNVPSLDGLTPQAPNAIAGELPTDACADRCRPFEVVAAQLDDPRRPSKNARAAIETGDTVCRSQPTKWDHYTCANGVFMEKP
jgi:hypothetical protein